MPRWQNISLDPGEDVHHLRPRVLRITQSVYRQLDPGRIPHGLDHWWNTPSISYQVEGDASQPSIVILNSREGQPDFPAIDTHFMINLNTFRIHDKFQDQRYPVPPDAVEDLTFVKDLVYRVVKSAKERREEGARRVELQNIEQQNALLQARTAYYERLVEESLAQCGIDAHDHQTACVLCGSEEFVTCNGCKITSCNGLSGATDCPGFHMDEVVSCVDHPRTSYCRACRAISGEKPILAQCPECDDWHCRQDQVWCIGRLVESDDSGKGPTTSNTNTKSKGPRSHPPKLEPCKSCLEEEGHNLRPFSKCDNTFSCWSNGAKICEECVPEEEGFTCSRGGHTRKWYCDDCASRKGTAVVWTCTGCKVVYCRECAGIDYCFECGDSDLCKQCVSRMGADKLLQEVEEKASGRLDLRWECSECHGHLCEKCAKEGVGIECEGCNELFCGDCGSSDRCTECGAELCRDCAEEIPCKVCENGCTGSAMESMAYETMDEYEYM